MLVFVVCALLLFFIFKKVEDDVGFSLGLSLFVAFVVTFCVSFVTYKISDCTTEHRVVSQQEIVAVADQNGVDGSFYLGCGQIQNEFYYFCYLREDDGLVSFSKFLASDKNVKISEEKRDNGILEKREIKTPVIKTPVNKIFLYPFVSLMQGKKHQKIFRVPENTIKKGMSFDLK